MELLLKRTLHHTATTGELSVDGVFECFTLEDRVREMSPDSDGDGIAEGKVMGDTAIPAGRYRVTIQPSKRFKRLMIYIAQVPFFTGILIHGGNTTEDTRGCILVGDDLDGTTIKAGASTPAIKRLFAKTNQELLYQNKVWITIE